VEVHADECAIIVLEAQYCERVCHMCESPVYQPQFISVVGCLAAQMATIANYENIAMVLLLTVVT